MYSVPNDWSTSAILGGTARLLRERSGHRAPPSIVRFYGATAENILSAGHDRSVRMFSAIKDERSKELSQGDILHLDWSISFENNFLFCS